MTKRPGNSAEGRPRHILALSGGKDSAALAVYMREAYPEIELEYVFTDSGCELPETYEFLDRIRALINIDITVLKPKKDFDYWVKYFNGVLPSPSNRWCTRLLKLDPYEEYVGEDQVYSYIALRADEKRAGYKPTNGTIIPCYPLVEGGLVLADVENILSSSGLGFPGYYSWRKRSGCYFCFFQTDIEWCGLKEFHPGLFERACQYEENHSDGRTYTWRQGKKGVPSYLRTLPPAFKGDGPASQPPSPIRRLSEVLRRRTIGLSPYGNAFATRDEVRDEE